MFYLYIAGIPGIAIPLYLTKAGRSVLARRYYEKQGVIFTTTYPFIGSEVGITGLLHRNKTRDYLYLDKETTDFVGSIRGFAIQLYAVNKEPTNILVHPENIGTYIDRDTPALYSFGQLSPSALTFTPITTENFNERKLHRAKGFSRKRMEVISRRGAESYCDRLLKIRNLDMKRIAGDFTREIMGEFVWGPEANALVSYKDQSGQKTQVPFMFSLNEPFSSCDDFVVLEQVDGFGQSVGAVGLVRTLCRMRQYLSWAWARSPGPRRRAWARLASFLGFGLVSICDHLGHMESIGIDNSSPRWHPPFRWRTGSTVSLVRGIYLRNTGRFLWSTRRSSR